MKIRQNTCKVFTALLALTLVLTVTPLTATTAYAAGYTTVLDLPTTAGSTLSSNIYRVKSSTTISYANYYSALSVASGHTAVIYIPKGVTLTVRGGHGRGKNAGAAGINLPSNSTLVVTGGGVLNVYGGNSGSSVGGSSGSYGYWNGGNGSDMCSGYGGPGGNGAGGAGAAIGGNGGTGGNGANGGSAVYGERRNGYSGGNGTSGSIGSSSGSVYVLGAVLVNTTGGASASGGGSGDYGSSSSKKLGRYAHTACGGGGGGGGGTTYSAPGIGGGTGGAGGGGGGGSGANTRGNDNNKGTVLVNTGSGGYAGSGGFNGSTGTRASGSWQGGSGGSSGSRGSSGSSGYIYKASTATINGNGYSSTVTNHNAVNFAVTLDQTMGNGGSASFTAVYGCLPPNITIPVLAQYDFMGYYTQPNGQGTRYFDHRGISTTVWEEAKDTTLYALWDQSQFNITFNKQSGIGGTDFIITTNKDGTLTSITPPTRKYHVFEGYFTQASGGGEQYYNAAGAVVDNKKLEANTTLFAKWRQNQFELRFDKLGGVGGTDNIYTEAEGVLPEIVLPTRVGHTLSGYSAKRLDNAGDSIYYNADGTPVEGKIISNLTTLFAQWTPQSYQIVYQGLDGADITDKPTTRDYMTLCSIPQPTKNDYIFLGWQLDNADARIMDLTIPANTPVYAKDITLTATWTKGTSTDVKVGADISGAISNPDEIKKQLREVFQTIVPDAKDDMGITAKDLDAESIHILLKVDKDTNSANQGLINSIAQNSVSEFYDIVAEKTITTADGQQPPVVLKEIPNHLDVKIPLTGELASQNSYVVYRVHEGIPERLSSDPTTGAEYYAVEDVAGTPNIVIRTRKFSTYAIAGTTKFIEPDGEDMATGEPQSGAGFDVQGRIIELDETLVYKIDINWGTMKYDFSTSKEWDPETHSYSESGFNGWRPEGFNGINNKLSAINHSNGDVIMNYTLIENNLAGVDMTLHLYNNIQAEQANSMQLPAAPIGSADSELTSFDAYLFLNGAPEDKWLREATNKTYSKVGRILVTVFPQQP